MLIGAEKMKKQGKDCAELAAILEDMSRLPLKAAFSERRAKFTNRKRATELLSRSGLAAIIAIAPDSVPYFSGYYNMDIGLNRDEIHIAVWPTEGEPVFILPERGPGWQPADPFVRDVRMYGRDITAMQLLAEVIAEKAWATARLGIEKDTFPVARYEELVKLAPGAEFVDCRHLIAEIKMIKTPGEIELYRAAARITDRAIRITYEMARPGDTEKSVADMMGYAITRLGADKVAFNVVASGESTILGHHDAEEVPLREGDIFRVDYGGLFSGYYTDMVRMAVVRKASDVQRSVYHRMVDIHREMLAAMRPGAVPSQVVARALKHYARVGLPPNRTFFGHGIGLNVHEEPLLIMSVERQLEPNMILCVENGWSDESARERYHIEDMILITEDGYELLTDYTSIDDMYVIT